MTSNIQKKFLTWLRASSTLQYAPALSCARHICVILRTRVCHAFSRNTHAHERKYSSIYTQTSFIRERSNERTCNEQFRPKIVSKIETKNNSSKMKSLTICFFLAVVGIGSNQICLKVTPRYDKVYHEPERGSK